LAAAAAKVGVEPGQAQDMLHHVVEQVASGGSLEGMAEEIAGKLGISPDQVQKFLPSVMGLLQGHADNAEEGVRSVIDGLTANLAGTPFAGLLANFDTDKDGSVADEAVGLVQGLFGVKRS
jgi:hypothetical protein